MKRIILLFFLLSLSIIVLLTKFCETDESCPIIECNSGTLNEKTCNCDCPDGFSGTNCETEDLCITNPIACENGGTPNADCTACDCPDGYIGTNCEDFDPTQVQSLLANHTPKELFDGGIILDSLYGKMYEGGIIFYLNTDNGTGMVAATSDQDMGSFAQWGCFGAVITGADGKGLGMGAQNTTDILTKCTEAGIAAKLCRDKGADWFLPSKDELNLMYTNLHANRHGGFAADAYWSSTEHDDFNAWFQYFRSGFQNFDKKLEFYHVRAARAF